MVIAKGAGISFFGSWMGQAAALIAGLVVARALGAEQYGLYTLGIVVATTLGVLSVVGLPLAAQRYVAIFRSEGDSGGTKGVILASLAIAGLISSLAGALLFSFAGFVGETVFGKPELTQVFRVLALAVPLLSVTSVAISCTYAFRTTKYGVLVQSGPRRGLLLPDLDGVDSVGEQLAIAKRKAGIEPSEPVQIFKFVVKRYE